MITNSPETMHCAAADSDHGRGIKPDPGMVNKRMKRKLDHTQNPKDVAQEESKITMPNSNTTANSANHSKAPKTDYIHVRARPGQATDTHSLAERLRREKISQRIKYLQDLVPGCNTITGKAGILDEIINYVQSLQTQVEFLSMKLATLDLKVDNYLPKQMFPACLTTVGPASHMVNNPANVQINTLDQGVSGPSCETGVNLIDITLRRAISAPVSMPDAFLDSYLNVSASYSFLSVNPSSEMIFLLQLVPKIKSSEHYQVLQVRLQTCESLQIRQCEAEDVIQCQIPRTLEQIQLHLLSDPDHYVFIKKVIICISCI